jgi:hypothetical protein
MYKPVLFKVVFLIFSLAISWSFNDPEPLLSRYFSSPLNEPVRLSGSFGELRPNHFHEGIDIKGPLGSPIYASADGFISRIGISGSGYGKALFISHPNGYTSLYAHMKGFTPEVDAYARRVQMEQQRFELDIELQEDVFRVQKGDLIGYIGLTGSTQGPHLHFEIRETDSGNAVNPLLMGVPYTDDIRPLMRQLKIYHLGPGLETLEDETLQLVSRSGEYGTLQDTLVTGAWRVGFGLKAFDRMNGSYNLNGIYSLEMFEDGERVYAFKLDRLQASESGFINAHLDYEEQVRRRSYFNRCFVLPGNELEIYRHRGKNTGIVQLSQYRAKHIRMVAGDLNGNTSELSFWIKRGPVPERQVPVYNYVLPHTGESIIKETDALFRFPESGFYSDMYLNYEAFVDSSEGYYSRIHQLSPALTPIHKAFEIAIKPAETFPEELKDKTFIGRCDLDNVIINYGGTWEKGYLRTRVKSFGDFVIMSDTTPPDIQVINFGTRHSPGQTLRFRIRDNVVGGGSQRGLRYEGSIDGRWVLMEYDAKNNLLTHLLESDLERGTHDFRLKVTDAMDNTRVFEQTFSY